MAKPDYNSLSENRLRSEDNILKTQIGDAGKTVIEPMDALASCDDISDYITIFEEFISIENISVKKESSAGG
ncbi:MAG: hypothetical protein K0S53_2566 [Bacteroidetes bacterium]|jgi:hypothetical protein|nr:hypothetical protein [Bacteroidota bacterium]MDF2453776.1 hypothetical protein [Bacteroidota bacterium]